MSIGRQKDESFRGDWETNEATFQQMGYKVGPDATLAELSLQHGDVYPEDSTMTILNPRRIRRRSDKTGISQDFIIVTAVKQRAV